MSTTLRGVNRFVFYGAPPPTLLMFCSVWPTDVLILMTQDDVCGSDWIPAPITSWARFEEANWAVGHVPAVQSASLTPPPSYSSIIANSPSVQVISDDEDEELFAAPPLPTSSVENISDDDDDADDDDDVFKN